MHGRVHTTVPVPGTQTGIVYTVYSYMYYTLADSTRAMRMPLLTAQHPTTAPLLCDTAGELESCRCLSQIEHRKMSSTAT